MDLTQIKLLFGLTVQQINGITNKQLIYEKPFTWNIRQHRKKPG